MMQTLKCHCFSMSLSKRVKVILEQKEYCRDNDMSLCSEVWSQECKQMGEVFSTMSVMTFLHYVEVGKLSKRQSILRRRREWNGKIPSLKGKSYNAKPKKADKYVKNRKLPNLLNRANAKINLSDMSGRHQFNPNPPNRGRNSAEQPQN